jgi:hypothetical protein
VTVWLRRYEVVWSDGVVRIIHARTWGAAQELARQLQLPAGVVLRHVAEVKS